MALNFPSSPSLNDTFSSGGITWVWNGSSWTTNRVETTLDSLSDVTLTGAANNDLLYRSGGAWIDTAGLLTWDGSTFLATSGTISGASVVALSNTLEVQGSFPFLQLNQTDGGTNEKKWVWIYDNTALEMRAVNDASSAYSQAFVMSRSGYAISSLTFGNATDNPTFTFSGTGLVTVGGAMSVTGQIRASGGSAGAPSYSFASDSNSGMFGNNAGEIYIVSDGTARLTVNSSGATVNGSLSASSVVATSSVMEIQGSFPFLQLNQTDGGTNEKRWVWIADGTAMELRAVNDASDAYTNAFTFTRSAQNVSNLTFGNATSNPTYTFAGTGAISGVGSGLTSLNASNISSGTLADARLSSNVVLENVSNTFTVSPRVSNTLPWVGLDENDQAADERWWLWLASGKVMSLRAYDDAISSSSVIMSATRGTGTAITNVTFGNATNNPTYTFAGTGAISGVGSGLTSLNATNLSSGTVADARLSSNVPLKDASATVSGTWNYTTMPTFSSNPFLFKREANGTATNQWVRIAKRESQNGRGTCIVRVYSQGGSQVPQLLEIFWDVAWTAATNSLDIRHNSLDYVTSVKSTKNTNSAAYLEIYVTGTSVALNVEVQEIGYGVASAASFETSFTAYTDDVVITDSHLKEFTRNNGATRISSTGVLTTQSHIYPEGQTVGRIQAVTGSYGSIEVSGADGSIGTWAGYSIDGEGIFMWSPADDRGGLYATTPSWGGDWYVQLNRNNLGEVDLYFNGTPKLTTSSAGVTVAGSVTTDAIIGTQPTDLNALNTASRNTEIFSSTFQPTNAPGGANYYSGIYFRHNISSDYGTQLTTGASGGEPFLFLRSKVNGTWGSYRDVYHSGNHLVIGGNHVRYNTETFIYDGDTIPHYGLCWYSDSATTGVTAALTGYYGIRIFTAGVGQAIFDSSGNLNFTNGGRLIAGASSTSGSVMMQGTYSNGATAVFGGEFSTGGPTISYASRPSTAASGTFVSSLGGSSLGRSAITVGPGTITMRAGSAQTVADGTNVTMSTILDLTTSGITVTGTVTATTFSGSGASLSSLVAANISSGNLGSGVLPYSTASATNSNFTVPFMNTTGTTSGNYGILIDSATPPTYNPSTGTLTSAIVSASTAVRAASGSNSAPGLSFTSTTNSGFYLTSGNVDVAVSGSQVCTFVSTANGALTVYDTSNSGPYRVGYRDLPQDSVAGKTLVAADAGKHIYSSSTVTVPASVFSAGQAVTIVNSTASSITVAQGASATMYLAGTATTGNRTLAQRGICTVLCVASNTFIISGAGLT